MAAHLSLCTYPWVKNLAEMGWHVNIDWRFRHRHTDNRTPSRLTQTLLGSCLTHMNDIVERDVMAVIVYILKTADKQVLDAHLSNVLCARLPQELKVCPLD